MSARTAATPRDDCLHPGKHCRGLPCPDCGKFSRHSWQTETLYTQNGADVHWGGSCDTHGDWSDSCL